MLDESMFEDIHEIAENSLYLKAVEEKEVSIQMLKELPKYEECREIEERLRIENKLSFEAIFNSPTGFYMLRCFLIADYAVEKAIFIKDVEAYRSMRFESARRKVSSRLYQRFVSTDENDARLYQQVPTLSVFQMIQQEKIGVDDRKDTNNIVNKPLAGMHLNTSAAGGIDLRIPTPSLPNNNHSTLTPSPSVLTTNNTNNPAALYAPTSQNSALHSSNPTIATNGHLIVPSLSSPSSSTGLGLSIPSMVPNALPLTPSHAQSTLLQMGHSNNPIGVYGKSVQRVRERVYRGEAPKDLFDEVARDVLMDLKLDAFPRFKQGDFYKRYITTKWIEIHHVQVKDFLTFRVLGRGGFGAVHACRKINSGQIYAMKAINKKLVKAKSALDNVLEERNVLTMIKSHFVTNLKYALQDEETLYLIMDLMLGGDLKFHLINAGRFTEKRARFYAAQVLLGLESLHKMSIIYRDMKLENVLLDHGGNCRLSDLGLAVVTKVKIKGYAGTPGYTAPEMTKNKLYGTAADIFSYGVMLYRMLCGAKPFKGKIDRDLDKAVIERKPTFQKEIFSKEAISLLTGLLQKRPENRLGCGERGIEEIKEHAFFESIDWGLLEAGYIDPPFLPNKYDVNAASLKDIGDFDRAKYKHTKLDDRFRQRIKNFQYSNVQALQEEMVAVLEKADQNETFEKFKPKPPNVPETNASNGPACCVLS